MNPAPPVTRMFMVETVRARFRGGLEASWIEPAWTWRRADLASIQDRRHRGTGRHDSMARLVFATHTARGHVVPLMSVARELIRRGHEVTWYTGEPYRRHVERSGATFAAPRVGRLTNYDTME